jgi:competence protein ComEA
VGIAFLAVLFIAGLPEGPGKELVEVICSGCHTTERVEAKQLTKTEWQSKVLEMLQEEPDVTQQERDKIVDYLAAVFPKHVNVNTASSSDLESILELTAKESAAIVAHRPYKSIDDLKKVPGLDPAKLESLKLRLDFQ